MKALTLYEPWASLMAYGWKEVETRGWYTAYRGPLAIHAAKAKPDPAEQSRITFALGHRGFELPPLSSGAVVCVGQLAACVPSRRLAIAAQALTPPFEPRHGWELERQFGNYDSGRWCWILRDVRRLTKPWPATGERKLWDLPATFEKLLASPGFLAPVTANVSTKPATQSARSAGKGL